MHKLLNIHVQHFNYKNWFTLAPTGFKQDNVDRVMLGSDDHNHISHLLR